MEKTFSTLTRIRRVERMCARILQETTAIRRMLPAFSRLENQSRLLLEQTIRQRQQILNQRR